MLTVFGSLFILCVSIDIVGLLWQKGGDKLQEEVNRRDEKIRQLREQIEQIQIDLGQEQYLAKMANSRVSDAQQEGNVSYPY